ncbi:excisionase family DNA binding protein [Mucilaginibacter yixingensis]|uniref:Excisionase family DNA binding protein n=1 Tax=Mucilaginibacter yixingensis TaxID=1295612 RepID=A0A2T5J4R7_9SPHI|nr:helix-turn-helix domain-containing protein [Mucilaginibacter yixingensis]PTQ92439.1 excisionase family DNA binding protein [Mucilaginibacter yixingensis]
MDPFNFNELPDVVRRLFEKVEQIELLLLRLQPKEDTDDEFLNINEAAAFLKVSVASLYSKVSRKEIPVSKPGKRLYFSRTELHEWVRSGKQKTSLEILSEYGGQRKITSRSKLYK